MKLTLEQLAEHMANIADRVGSRSFVDVNAIADSIRAALAEQPEDQPTDWKALAEAAEAKVAKMRPVVESAVRWLSDLTEYAELELERTARDYRDKEVTDEQNKD